MITYFLVQRASDGFVAETSPSSLPNPTSNPTQKNVTVHPTASSIDCRVDVAFSEFKYSSCIRKDWWIRWFVFRGGGSVRSRPRSIDYEAASVRIFSSSSELNGGNA